MVATPTDSTTPAPGSVSPAFPARHGRHAAAARARRALPPEHVRAVRAAADDRPRAHKHELPRWHSKNHVHELADQADPKYTAVHGRAWVWRYDSRTGRREPVREGTRSRVAWLSRRYYLGRTVPLRLALSDADGILRAHRVDRDTFCRWIRYESVSADEGSGRRCVVRAATVAQLMEIDERTVKRCRSVARELGLYATVHRGRMLGQMEQTGARWKGSKQRGMAAESWFVVPPELWIPDPAGERITTVSSLHRGSGSGHLTNLPEPVVTLTTRGGEGATPSPSTRVRRRRAPSPGYRLAEQVVQRLPWAAGCPVGRLAGILGRFGSGRHPWTAQDVVQHIDTVNRRRGWSAIASADELRAPAFALLASYLRDADPDADHPRLPDFEAADARARDAAERMARRRAAAESAARRTAEGIAAAVRAARAAVRK